MDSTSFHIIDMMDWIKLILSPGCLLGIPSDEIHKFQIFAAVACDSLWFNRNKAFHTGQSVDAIVLSKSINSLTLEHYTAWHQSTQLEQWIPPPPQWFKINFDTAIRSTFSAQSAVCRDMKGHIIRMISIISPHCSANYGEALAAQLGLSLALILI
jgi:hypothetical protein